jgi:hypothetical protein
MIGFFPCGDLKTGVYHPYFFLFHRENGIIMGFWGSILRMWMDQLKDGKQNAWFNLV